MTALLWESPCRRIALHVGDCRELMASMADKSVDHVITDPPYSEHVHAKSKAGSGERAWSDHSLDSNGCRSRRRRIAKNRDLGFVAITPDLLATCAREFARLAQRWSLVFSDVESSHLWRNDLIKSGLDYVRTGAWVKQGGAPQFTGDRPAVGFEAITIVHPSGKKRWSGGGSVGVWSFPVCIMRNGLRGLATGQANSEDRIHTTQKPIALMRKLVSLFTDTNDLILDPFAGSATTLVAAYEQGRRAIGCELDPKNADAAAKRLERMVAQGSLFGAHP